LRNPVVIIVAVVILAISFLVFTNTAIFVRGYVAAKDTVSVAAGPVLKGISTATNGLRSILDSYVNLLHTKRENDDLKKRLADLQIQSQRMAELERENTRLRAILSFTKQQPDTLVAARVIGEDLKNWYRCIIIDKGKSAGLKERMPVVTARGLVGQIVEAHQWHSKVMVINDTNSSVDTYIEGKNTRGILEGTGQSTLRMKYVRKTDEAEAGDKLITSGKDGVYPRGLPVGIITSVQRTKAGIFSDIDVMPYSDFRRLDEVLVVGR
jgi:rod shape-determining protein MreC